MARRSGATADPGPTTADPGDDSVPTNGNRDDASAGDLRARLRAHRLSGPAARLADLDLLLCGFQDAGPGTALASIALRTGSTSAVLRAVESRALVSAMTLRGAPHAHRAADLAVLRDAQSAPSAADIEATNGPLSAEVFEVNDPVGAVATALDQVVRDTDGPISKADLSTAATPLLQPDLAPYCTPCGAHHAIDGLFRVATLRAWLVLVQGARTQTFERFDEARAVDRPSDRAVTAARRTLLGAAARASVTIDVEQIAGWLGWDVSGVRRLLPDATPRRRNPATVPSARLLPARDPWLRGTDRNWLLGSHTDRRSEVFRSLGAPGVVLLEGEIVGVWRQRKSGKKLAVAVELWRPLDSDRRDELESDAAVVAASRDLSPTLDLTTP